jgi:hypothetical protein
MSAAGLRLSLDRVLDLTSPSEAAALGVHVEQKEPGQSAPSDQLFSIRLRAIQTYAGFVLGHVNTPHDVSVSFPSMACGRMRQLGAKQILSDRRYCLGP